MHHYYEKVCLIQISLPDGSNYLVDPLTEFDISEFMEVLAEKIIVLHDAAYDLRMLRASFGFQPRGEVFDTMLAAQLLGYTKFGLVDMIERFFGIALSKSIQKSDWSRRPLLPKQLEYACDDTRYLLQMADQLYEKLHALERHDWHRQSCQRAVEAAAIDKPPTDPDKAWRIKGLAQTKHKTLAFVRQIWLWREEYSQKFDIPPFKVMANQLIIKLAEWAGGNPDKPLSQGPRLPRTCKGRQRQELEDAIQKVHRMAKSEYPQQTKSIGSKPSGPDLAPQIKILRKECSILAEKLKLAPHIIAPRASLEAVIYKKATTVSEIVETAQLMTWQANLILPAVKKIAEAN